MHIRVAELAHDIIQDFVIHWTGPSRVRHSGTSTDTVQVPKES